MGTDPDEISKLRRRIATLEKQVGDLTKHLDISQDNPESVNNALIATKRDIDFDALEDIFAKMDEEFVGFHEVKRFLADLSKDAIVRKVKGTDHETKSNHIAIAGNPGVGKSSIVSYIAKILHAAGALEKSSVYKVNRADLVGQYIGYTEPKVKNAVNKALGGVLFIDDAASLANSSSNDFGRVAMQTLLTLLEEKRGQFICVMASYPEGIKRVLNLDQGLASRFAHRYHIRDFSAEELFEIFKKMADETGLSIDDDALPVIERIIARCVNEGNPAHFGNARWIRNIVEAMSEKANVPPQVADLSFREVYDLACEGKQTGEALPLRAMQVHRMEADLLAKAGIRIPAGQQANLARD